MPPIFGGRLWTTVATWSLMIPAVGIGYAVRDPNTPYLVFLALALLCGFGGGNFASSMANISFFFPKTEKGNALALNAGLGNLGARGLVRHERHRVHEGVLRRTGRDLPPPAR
jgi:NNP family nitrate/nitrite transporter-like MFS transporter